MGAGIAAGGLILARPLGILAQPLEAADGYGTSRTSRLRDPAEGWRLVHADMHNHSHLSDGDGDPSAAFGSMRDTGLDIACLTDHASLSWSPEGVPGLPICAPLESVGLLPGLDQVPLDECQSLVGLDNDGWELTGRLAAEATVDAAAAAAGERREFLAVRGFEWSSPTLGHMNCWFTDRWIDPLNTLGLSGGAQLEDFVHPGVEALPAPIAALVDGLLDGLVGAEAVASMSGIHRWLGSPGDTPVRSGGRQGLAGFNHPGRESGRFGQFVHDPALQDQVVTLEVFNRNEDYLLEALDSGRPTPLVQCLDAGWTPGLIGVTDEHGTNWGEPEGKGRGGMWVRELTIPGMKEAMLTRQVFATRIKGLRLDATANGVLMGAQQLGHRDGSISFAVDLDHGPASWGTPVQIQVLAPPQDPASQLPDILMVQDAVVPRPSEPVIRFRLPAIDVALVPWIVLRITGPERPGFGVDERSAGTPFEAFGAAWAYTSPWYLDGQAALPEDPDGPGGPGDPGGGDGPGGGSDPGGGGGSGGEPGGGGGGPGEGGGSGGARAVVTRLAGPGRVETAVEVSRRTFVAGVDAAFVATAATFADALVATSAAAAAQAPLLLTAVDALPEATRAELVRLAPTSIVVLGGSAAVGAAVEAQLADLAGTDGVRRLAGEDRYGTAAAVAVDTFPTTVEEVWVATGEGFADALSGAAAAARRGAALLTVQRDGIPDVVAAELVRLRPARIVVLGGSAAVSGAVVTELRTYARDVVRLAGEDRFETAAAVARSAFDTCEEVLVASGADFPDALAAGPSAFLRMAPVLLVQPDAIPAATDAELRRLGAARITVVGGTAAVSAAVEDALATYPSA